jgi:hypothetical protein
MTDPAPTIEEFVAIVQSDLDRIIAEARTLAMKQIEQVAGYEDKICAAMNVRNEDMKQHKAATIGAFICKLYESAGFTKRDCLFQLHTLLVMLTEELSDDYDQLRRYTRKLARSIFEASGAPESEWTEHFGDDIDED